MGEKQGCEKTEWRVRIYPKGFYNNSEDEVSVYVVNLKKIPLKISYKFSILDLSLEKHHIVQSHQIDLAEKLIDGTGVAKWLSRQKLKNDAATFLPGGQITVYCELTVHYGYEPAEEVDICSKVNKFKEEVGESLVKLLDDKDLTDMTIKCGAQEFPCHSLILSARSPVFKAMFQANMKESETREVIIEDIEPAVFAEMLHFIYTGGTKENTLEEIGVELLAAADKYQLDSLKEICVGNLCSDLECSNAVQYLILGDMYESMKLREKALKKVATNMASIVKTEAFQELKQYPDILIDILKVVA